ncbi:MAG: response regulator [Planctomycetaceae bacterium]|nr:response regulator [Planctomycetaceae bacterium]
MTPQPSKPRVLIVDDHPANRLAFKMLLDPLYTVTVASNGTEALMATLEADYAVILLDVRMPGMNGFEVAEQFRKYERTRYTPIIFMSAYDRTELQAKKGYIAGATDYLFSPVDPDLLKFKVATYVQIYLRNESLWLQVHRLQETVRVLQEELSRCSPTEQMQRQIEHLQSQIDVIKSELDPVPF